MRRDALVLPPGSSLHDSYTFLGEASCHCHRLSFERISDSCKASGALVFWEGVPYHALQGGYWSIVQWTLINSDTM